MSGNRGAKEDTSSTPWKKTTDAEKHEAFLIAAPFFVVTIIERELDGRSLEIEEEKTWPLPSSTSLPVL